MAGTFKPEAMYVRAMSAEEVLDALIKVATEWPSGANVRLYMQTNIGGFTLSPGAQIPRKALAEQPAVAQFLTQIKGRAEIACVSAYCRIDNDENRGVNYLTTDGITGQIEVKVHSEPQHASQISAVVVKHFKPTNYVGVAREIGLGVDQTAIQLRERSVADLREEVGRLAQFLGELAVKEAATRQKLQTELQESYQQRLDALEAEYRTRQGQLDQKKVDDEKELAGKSAALTEREQAFDLRNARGVRRDLLKQISDVLKAAEVHSASQGTQDKRTIVHRVVWGLIGVATIVASLSGWKLFLASAPSGAPDWHYWISFGTSMATIVTTTVYYLKWNDRWFREHADAEFAAKRYKADILRASWLAELAAEWKREEKAELSPQLVEAFSRSLFAEVSASHASEHPMDEMTGLLKRATEVQINKKGFSIRGIKDAVK